MGEAMQVIAQTPGEKAAEYLGCVAPDARDRGDDRLDVQDQFHGVITPEVPGGAVVLVSGLA
jgi:hypothetical protein